MRVLITGMCGFIGHHVADYLLRYTDWDLTGVDRLDATSTLHRLRYIDGWGSGVEKRVRFVWHDLRAPINAHVDREIGDVDLCLHLAASTHVDRSIADPLAFVLDNTVGTCNLLEWWRVRQRRFFMYISTDEVFGPAEGDYKFKEWDRYRSASPYSASKAGAEELVCAYANTYKIRAGVARMMNVIGPRQHPEKFLPMTIRKVLRGEEVLVHADAECRHSGTRVYTHVDNVSKALLWIAENGAQQFDKWNVVGEREVSNLELAQQVAEIVGKPLNYRLVPAEISRPGHDFRYACDGSKLRTAGFEPVFTFEEGLRHTVDWFLSHREWLEG